MEVLDCDCDPDFPIPTWIGDGGLQCDKFRGAHFVDYEPEVFTWSERQDMDFRIDRGMLEVVRPTGPVEFEFELYNVSESAFPAAGVNFWLRALSEGKLRNFQAASTHVEYDPRLRNLYIQALDRTPPPVMPEPCKKCEKRRQRKWRKRILKAGRKQWGRKFKTIEELNDYEDSFYSEW